MPASRPKTPGAASRGEAPKLADVARAAGVSKMAASSALNGGSRGSARVSAETRERVLAAAERLGYRPNATARALASRRTNAIGFVANFLGDAPNLYFLEVLSGVIQGATLAGQTTAVFPLPSWTEARARVPSLCDGRVDGLILLAPRLHDDASAWLPARMPLVTVHANSLLSGVTDVGADDEAGAHALVRRLLSMGHRRILHVGGPEGYSGSERRVQGYLRAHAEAGVKPPAGHVLRTSFDAEGGRQTLRDWLLRQRGRPVPHAVFGGNDAIAAGCMEALQAHGLRVPDDVSVVGYDDTLMARTMHMATVHQPLHEMGRRAVEVLLQRIEALRRGESGLVPPSVVFPTEIIDGATLAAPRAAALSIA